MEQIFRVGDTVYHWNYGKGKVNNMDETLELSIHVLFEDGGEYFFTRDGAHAPWEHPVLSHTPYDFVNGGFSQKPPYKKDTPGIDHPMVELHQLWSVLNKH